MQISEFNSRIIMAARIAGEMNAMGEISIPEDMESQKWFDRFIENCVWNYDAQGIVEPFDLWMNAKLSEEYTADYTRECRDLSDRVFSKLFYGSPYSHGDMRECPSGAYQLLVSGLELCRWEITGQKNREATNRVLGILENLRDQQKKREYDRRKTRAAE